MLLILNGDIKKLVDELEERKKEFTYDKIYNYDETRFEWELKSQFTYDFKGMKNIKGLKTSKAGHCVTVLLMIRADGFKLPALIIFKRKRVLFLIVFLKL